MVRRSPGLTRGRGSRQGITWPCVRLGQVRASPPRADGLSGQHIRERNGQLPKGTDEQMAHGTGEHVAVQR